MSSEPQEFKVTDLFRLYRATNELVHSDEEVDLEAPVKFATNTGDEFLVTGAKLDTTDAGEQILWLEGVIDE